MMSQHDPQQLPNLHETYTRRRYDVACQVGFLLLPPPLCCILEEALVTPFLPLNPPPLQLSTGE